MSELHWTIKLKIFLTHLEMNDQSFYLLLIHSFFQSSIRILFFLPVCCFEYYKSNILLRRVNQRPFSPLARYSHCLQVVRQGPHLTKLTIKMHIFGLVFMISISWFHINTNLWSIYFFPITKDIINHWEYVI